MEKKCCKSPSSTSFEVGGVQQSLATPYPASASRQLGHSPGICEPFYPHFTEHLHGRGRAIGPHWNQVGSQQAPKDCTKIYECIPDPWVDPKSRSTLRLRNLHQRSVRVQKQGVLLCGLSRGSGITVGL